MMWEYHTKPKSKQAHTWLQWKSSDAIVDFNCKCGFHGVATGYFIYNIQCPKCGTMFSLNGHLEIGEHQFLPKNKMEYAKIRWEETNAFMAFYCECSGNGGTHFTLDTEQNMVDDGFNIYTCDDDGNLTAKCNECEREYTVHNYVELIESTKDPRKTACQLAYSEGDDIYAYAVNHDYYQEFQEEIEFYREIKGEEGNES